MTFGSDQSLENLLSGAQLPALSQSALHLFELSQDPDNGPREFAIPIEGDPGLTVQVLKFVNSSFFGFSREISSVQQAITLVGIRTIKNFALYSAVFSLMPNPKCGPFDLKSLWQDSLRRGLFARAMGGYLGVQESEDLFAGALLQDMAVPLLAKELPGEYAGLLDSREGGRYRLSELEQDRFGWTHAQAAGVMARNWSLPEDFASLIETHLDLDDMLTQDTPPKLLAVALSALLPSTFDCAWSERDKFVSIFDRLKSSQTPTVNKTLAAIDSEFEAFAPILNLSIKITPLADTLTASGAGV